MAATIPQTEAGPRFSDYPKFKPHYTPRELLELGVKGGSLLFLMSRRILLPEKLWLFLSYDQYMAPLYDADNNYFDVEPEKYPSFEIPHIMKRNGGWLMWYFNFYYGLEKDKEVNAYHIDFWVKYTRIWTAYFDDVTRTNEAILPKYRQSLLELSFDSTQTLAWDPLFA